MLHISKYIRANALAFLVLLPLSVNARGVEHTNIIYISGQRTGLMEVADKEGSAIREAFDRIRKIVEQKGATMANVVKITIYLADPENDYPHIRSIVPEYFSHPGDIARSIVGVTRIPDNDGTNFKINRRVQIDAVIAK